MATKVGIDLGTANVLVYIKGKGIVLNEPSVVAVNRDTDEILAIGEEARQMLGRTPANITAAKPLKDGVISDYDITERMLKYFIRKTCGSSRFFKPVIMVCVPSGVTEVEKRAVREAAIMAGGKEVYLMEEPLAAAIGAGMDVTEPSGKMVIDIGGGTTDIAVIALGGIVTSASIKMAGDKFDEYIVRYMRKVHKLYIGERTGEDIKKAIGTAYPREEEVSMECRGRDLVTGLPKTVTITSEEMMEAIAAGTGCGHQQRRNHAHRRRCAALRHGPESEGAHGHGSESCGGSEVLCGDRHRQGAGRAGPSPGTEHESTGAALFQAGPPVVFGAAALAAGDARYRRAEEDDSVSQTGQTGLIWNLWNGASSRKGKCAKEMY